MNPLYKNLNEKQVEAVDYQNGPLLIVAGAGSGKTKTLTSRLAAILKLGVSPENIIAITFTNKAAEEMQNRIMDKKPPFIGTFHSLGARILKKEANFVDRSRNFSIFDSDDSLRLIKNIIKNFNLTGEERRDINHFKLRKEFSRIKGGLAEIEDEDEIIGRFFGEYENALEKNNAFDFDDLIEKPVKIFRQHPAILEKYQNQFQHILVDEFQDTNVSQYAFIKLLSQKHKNLSVVGDDQQSIYRFRGSDFRIFLDFEKDWPKTKVVLLEQNYRSSGNIIRAASALISGNKFQKPKNLWTENPDGELLKVIEHRDEDAEAEWIAEKISGSKKSNQSIAVLYRTNAQSRALETVLIERGIPYRIFGGVRFYERKEIKDIVAALRWGINPKDAVSLERLKTNLLKKPFLEIKNGIPEKIKKLSPAELIAYVLEATDYLNQLKKNYANYQERTENINELIYFAGNFGNLQEFLEAISLLQGTDIAKNNETTANVHLMTIHLAKGLEFDKVFIAGCNEGLLPHQMSYSGEAEIEEERRLMYVAMTRAKKELYLNFYNLASRFLYEIPPELVEVSAEKSLDDEERYIEM